MNVAVAAMRDEVHTGRPKLSRPHLNTLPMYNISSIGILWKHRATGTKICTDENSTFQNDAHWTNGLPSDTDSR